MTSGYALVTGASQGLGSIYARALAAERWNLVLVARSRDQLEGLAAELRSGGIKVEPITCDLARPAAGRDLAAELRSRGLRIDLLVNNAGFGLQGEFRQLSLERQVGMIQLHCASVVELTHELLPAMVEQHRGGIINISSMAGFQAIPYAALYSATKSFLSTFSLALEREAGRHGVAVVTVAPGRLRPVDSNAPQERQKFPGGEQDPQIVVAESLKMLARGGGLLVPGAFNKLMNLLGRCFPRRLVTKAVGKMSRPKKTD